MSIDPTYEEKLQGDAAYLTPCIFLEGTDIIDLNDRLWELLRDRGNPITFGDSAERKKATEAHITLHISGYALEQIRRGEVPDGWKFRGDAVKEYMKTFSDNPDDRPKGHTYNYAERLFEYIVGNTVKIDLKFKNLIARLKGDFEPNYEIEYVKVNQLKYMRELLELSMAEKVTSNRIVAITLQPGKDYLTRDMPCLQFLQLRALEGRRCSLRILYRSHDYGDAVWANLCYIIAGIEKYVTDPANARIVEIILTSTSGHIYDHSMDMVNDRLEKLMKEKENNY